MNDQSDKMEFIERVGIQMEELGMPRQAGRILGWLMICTPRAQSAEDLMQTLSASKGGISSMTRLLMHYHFIEKVVLPGERRDYFRIRKDCWGEIARLRLSQVGQFRSIADASLEITQDMPAEERAELEEMAHFYRYLDEGFKTLLKNYHPS